MPEISQWELDKLKEHEQAYYELLEERNNLVDALTPLVKEIITTNLTAILKEE